MNKYLKKLLPLYQKMGANLIPDNYEQPVPRLSDLKGFDWEKEGSFEHVEFDARGQVGMLKRFVKRYRSEYDAFPYQKTTQAARYYYDCPAFRTVDAEIYYGLIRERRPKRIIEIGAGFSTFLAAQAVLENSKRSGSRCELTAIDPHASGTFKAGFPGLTRLIPNEVQKVPIGFFGRLKKNDILFIDSSHILRIGSDVQYELFDILPSLRSGVLIHFHDIFIPWDYPKKLITQDFLFYNEQYLLQAFLMHNHDYRILWASQWMHRKHPRLLSKSFGSYDKGFKYPTSFWMIKK